MESGKRVCGVKAIDKNSLESIIRDNIMGAMFTNKFEVPKDQTMYVTSSNKLDEAISKIVSELCGVNN